MTDRSSEERSKGMKSFPDFPPPLDMKEFADCEIYQNGEYLCPLLGFVERLARDYSNADPWRKLHEEHLLMCDAAAKVFGLPKVNL